MGALLSYATASRAEHSDEAVVDEDLEAQIHAEQADAAEPHTEAECAYLLYELRGKYDRHLWGVFSSLASAELAYGNVQREHGVARQALYLTRAEVDVLQHVRRD